MSCTRFRVTGRVQGVFFRASTQREARRLGLAGYARNLHDGSVEVEAQGNAEALEEFAQWLAHGPPHAQVSDLSRDDCVEPTRHGDFVIS